MKKRVLNDEAKRHPSAAGDSQKRGVRPAKISRLDAVLKVRLRSEEKAAFWTLANRARLTASALARRRLLGLKVRFEPQQAAVEYLRQACVLTEALAAKRAGVDDEDIAAILAAQRAAMDCLGADLHGATREQAPR